MLIRRDLNYLRYTRGIGIDYLYSIRMQGISERSVTGVNLAKSFSCAIQIIAKL
jgi:hypothetical protein